MTLSSSGQCTPADTLPIVGVRLSTTGVRLVVDVITCFIAWTLVAGLVTPLGIVRTVVLSLTVASSVSLITWRHRGYSSGVHVSRVSQHRILLRSCLTAGVLVVVVDQVGESTLGAGSVIIATFVSAILQQVGRAVVDRWERRGRRSGRLGERVLVIADDDSLHGVLDLIDDVPDAGWTVVGCAGHCFDQASARGLDHTGASGDVMEGVEACSASVIVVTADALKDERCYVGVLAARRAGVDVHVDAGLRGLNHRDVRANGFGHDTVLYLDHARLLGLQHFGKRTLDVVVSMFVLVVASPILAVAALMVKLEDRGPVLFWQQRVGRGGELFKMPKLRSMGVDAEAHKAELAHLNQRDGGPLFKIDRDPRVTRTGRVIRALSIDELPQLVSVLRGHMSLVGPRPALPDEVAEFDPRLTLRHDVRPGVTGLWQVEARDDESFGAYRRLDLFYVDNWSLLLDCTILAHTVPAVVGRGRRALFGASSEAASRRADSAIILRSDELVA